MESDFRGNNNLRALRKAAGYSQTQLGELAGVSLRQLSYWESGRGLSLRDACTLADIFGCSLDELAGRERSGDDPRAAELLAAFQQLDDDARSLLTELAKVMAKEWANKEVE